MKMLKCLAISAIVSLMWMLPGDLWGQGEGGNINHLTPVGEGKGFSPAECSPSPFVNDNTYDISFDIIVAEVADAPNICPDLYLVAFDANFPPLKVILGVEPIPYSSFTYTTLYCPNNSDLITNYKNTIDISVDFDRTCNSTTPPNVAYSLATLVSPGKYTPFHYGQVSNTCMNYLFPEGCFEDYNNDGAFEYEYQEGLECCEEGTGGGSISFTSPGNVKELTYSNPFENQLDLTMSVETGSLQISLFDLKGQQILNKIVNTEEGVYRQTIDTSELSKGIYILHIRQGESYRSLKVAKF